MDLICRNSKNYALTVGQVYTDAEVAEGRDGYVRLRNNNGVLVNYDRRLFDEVVTRTATPVPPTVQAPPRPVPFSLDTLLEEKITLIYPETNGGTGISMSIEIADGIVFQPNASLLLREESIDISCGIGQISGISYFVTILKEEFLEFFSTAFPERAADRHYNLEVNMIIAALIEKMFMLFLSSDESFAIYLLSNANDDHDFNDIFEEAMSEIATEVGPVTNPNSGNHIMLWVLETLRH